MNSKVKIFLFIIISLCHNSILTARKVSKEDYYLSIKQVILPFDLKILHYEYEIKKNELKIFVIKFHPKKEVKKQQILKKKIKREMMSAIEEQSRKILYLKNEYIQPMLDGYYIEIYLRLGNFEKKIKVINMIVDEIKILFDIINTLIPSRKPKLIVKIFSEKNISGFT